MAIDLLIEKVPVGVGPLYKTYVAYPCKRMCECVSVLNSDEMKNLWQIRHIGPHGIIHGALKLFFLEQKRFS